MYQFTNDCYIGIDEIDDEHKKLFKMLNNAILSMQQVDVDKTVLAKSLLEELRSYAITHFSHEEAYMEKINDPELPRQRREHRAFVDKIDSYSNESCTKENAEKTMVELLNFLVRWLYRHILSSDILIGKLNVLPSKQQKEDTKEPEFLTFSSKYYTGIDFIDDEHKQLFEIIKRAYYLIKEEFIHDKYDHIVDILEELKEYTETHFTHEEEYMEKIQYIGLPAQQHAHTAFIERLVEVTYSDLDKIDENQHEYLNELMDFLFGWLVNHILKMDILIPIEEE